MQSCIANNLGLSDTDFASPGTFQALFNAKAIAATASIASEYLIVGGLVSPDGGIAQLSPGYRVSSTLPGAPDEGLVQRNPAKRLELPPVRKPCERFLSMDEVRALTAVATGRERLILRLFLVAGLRPAELFALRTDDVRPGELRID